MKKFLLIVMIFAALVGGCSKSNEDINFQNVEELNQPQYTIAAVVGAASEPYVPKAFPNAVEKQFPVINDMVIALESKKVDAIVFTRAPLDNVLAEKPNTLQILPQAIGKTDMHMVISPKTELANLKNEVNDFLKAKKADGTLEKAYKYWFDEHKTELPADIPKIQGATKKLVVVTMGTVPPQSFYSGENLSGFDI